MTDPPIDPPCPAAGDSAGLPAGDLSAPAGALTGDGGPPAEAGPPAEVPAWRDEPPTEAELYGLWPDPFGGPPDGSEAWLADLAAPELDALLEEQAAAASSASGLPGGREPIAAGFTHRDPGPATARRATVGGAALGFAAGGALDLLAPDPVLAGFTQEVFDSGLGQLSDDELVGVLCAARRLSSWQAAMEFAAVSGLDARRMARAARPGASR